MYEESQRMWKEPVVTYSRHYLGIFLELMRKTQKYHSGYWMSHLKVEEGTSQ
jgi:hypothetical protein